MYYALNDLILNSLSRSKHLPFVLVKELGGIAATLINPFQLWLLERILIYGQLRNDPKANEYQTYKQAQTK